MSLLRDPVSPFRDPYTARVLEFMHSHGHTGYMTRIKDLQARFDEVQAEAGPNGYLCPETQRQLDQINEEIDEVGQEAVDRYDDWASDPLP
jgi:hypothetical protein